VQKERTEEGLKKNLCKFTIRGQSLNHLAGSWNSKNLFRVKQDGRIVMNGE
jgi:hypothetical protein